MLQCAAAVTFRCRWHHKLAAAMAEPASWLHSGCCESCVPPTVVRCISVTDVEVLLGLPEQDVEGRVVQA